LARPGPDQHADDVDGGFFSLKTSNSIWLMAP
jgi:hypothetical protein